MQGRTVTVTPQPTGYTTTDGVTTPDFILDNYAPSCSSPPGPVSVSVDGVTGLPRADGSIDAGVGQIDFVGVGEMVLRGLAPGADGQTILLRAVNGPTTSSVVGESGDLSISIDNAAPTSYPNWQFSCERDGVSTGPNSVVAIRYRRDIGKWVVS